MSPSHEYQRARKPATLKRLASKWQDNLVGALIVNIINGQVWVDDGCHRWEVSSGLFGPDYELPCVVNENLNDSQESDVVIRVNRDRTSLSKWDEYRFGVSGGHDPYRSIEKTLNKHGLAMAEKARNHHIGAVQAVISIARTWGLDVLSDTVELLGSAFTQTPRTWDGDILQAVARLLGVNSHTNHHRLIKTLQQHDVDQWKTRSRRTSAGGSTSRSVRMAEDIADAYSARLRSGRIFATKRAQP